MLKKVLIARPLPEGVVAEARKHFAVDVRKDTKPMSLDEMQSALRDYDGVMPTLGDMFEPAIFAGVDEPRCRILANFGVGYNHIDAVAANAAGLTITNTPGAVTDATADIAMTLMLMSARRAGLGERLVRSGAWQGWHPTQMLGLHLSGKTVGIVGMGRIGKAIAQRCHFGFGMKVAYVSRSSKTLPFEAQSFKSLIDMAATVDVIAVAVPGGAQTHHLKLERHPQFATDGDTEKHRFHCRRSALARRPSARHHCHLGAQPSWRVFRNDRWCGLRAFHRLKREAWQSRGISPL